jgi:nitric oxide reductase NorD protein
MNESEDWAPDSLSAGQDDFLDRRSQAGPTREELALRYGNGGGPPDDALDVETIHAELERLVYMVLSIRRSVLGAAERLAWFPRARVELILGQVELVSRTSLELAYHLCQYAPEALQQLPDEDIHDWVIQLLEIYDRAGTQGCIRAMRDLPGCAARRRERQSAQDYAGTAIVLQALVAGLAGRRLRLGFADEAYTDTETLHLPPSLSLFLRREDNFVAYKATIAYLWAQTWFGTWREPVLDHIGRFASAERALRLFQGLERLRLDACLERELPGLWRQIGGLADAPVLDGPWLQAAQALAKPGASVGDSWGWVAELYARRAAPLAPACYQGVMHPAKVAAVMAARAAREQSAFQEALAVIADELGGNLSAPEARASFEVRQQADDSWPGGIAFQLVLGDQPVQPALETVQLMHSIVQDFGQIPAEYLVPAGQGLYQRKREAAREDSAGAAAEDAYLYDEWDYTRKGYRKAWCQLRERDVHPQRDDFVRETREKYRGLLKQLYRTFEALRGEDKLLKREPHGEDPDIDALVDAYADRMRGLEMSERLFQRRQRLERDLAVLFMVDMSGSTKGWINEVERESLVLLCEAMELLGDRYAIYGFSGFTHMRCELFRVKGFDEPYDERVEARISGIRPQDYTRMGVMIRHLTRKLLEVDARTRVLIALSDGRPDDEDGYRGDYGIEDTRQAVLEARSQGIHPFCITIDDEAQAYLPHMFGPASYTLVENVAKLPYRVSDIYRRITA